MKQDATINPILFAAADGNENRYKSMLTQAMSICIGGLEKLEKEKKHCNAEDEKRFLEQVAHLGADVFTPKYIDLLKAQVLIKEELGIPPEQPLTKTHTNAYFDNIRARIKATQDKALNRLRAQLRNELGREPTEADITAAMEKYKAEHADEWAAMVKGNSNKGDGKTA